MWAINNQTKFKADRTFARDAEGAEVWIVAVRATFAIKPEDHVVLSDEQQGVCVIPKYFGEPGRSSLRYDVDLVRTKPGTDVILNAHAHSPDKKPVPYLDVTCRIGTLIKRLRIVGNRVWKKGVATLKPSEPEPFVSLPIRYELAWGGPLSGSDARATFNPVGIGVDAAPGKPVPNCEYPDNPVRSPNYKGSPAGFGPIPCDWEQRVKLAGTYDDAWQKERQPLVPKDFQDAYFRCAPVDQQFNGFLQGGEEVVLGNLVPEGLLRFRLPRVSLGFNTRIAGGATHHRGQLHTVIIEPDERRLIMVWQTALPCHHSLYTLKQTIVFEKERLSREALEDLEAELAF
jgi:hypothetical protein